MKITACIARKQRNRLAEATEVRQQCHGWADAIEDHRRKEVLANLRKRATGKHVPPPSLFEIWRDMKELPSLIYVIFFITGIVIGALMWKLI